jgi:glycosyltransferase involved in cell wall biosynthesis
MSTSTHSPVVRMVAAARPVHLTIVSTSPPQRCGIASYTTDIVHALAAVAPTWRVDVCALDNDGAHYTDPVLVVATKEERSDYVRAADEIASRGTDLVLIQHEYGIFGGADGEYLLDLTHRLRQLGVPYVVTLHTVLSHPTENQARVLKAICADAALVTVFTDTALRILLDENLLDPARAVVAAHGAPAVLRADPTHLQVGDAVAVTLNELVDSTVLCTFGLLGPSKGIEVAIRALPAIVDQHPNAVYLIAGATHPGVAKLHGERYRESLVELAAELGVANNVRFLDAFFTDDEVAALLAASTVYLTPYLGTEQSSSGTLTFALTAGLPVVSTRYRYAVDLLAAQSSGVPSGILVESGDFPAIANAVNALLDDPAMYQATRDAADARGATLTWPAVADTLVRTLLPVARTRRSARARAATLTLDHLERLVEQNGITQFARLSEPSRPSGYCVDDVARLGIVAASLCRRGGRDGTVARDWLVLTLRFLAEARDDPSTDPNADSRAGSSSGLRNMRDRDGGWLDDAHPGDHVGRAIWALGVISGSAVPAPIRRRAQEMLLDFLPLAAQSHGLRPTAFAILGLARSQDPAALEVLAPLAAQLDDALQAGSEVWPWFEDSLTYDNARLPQALLAAGIALHNTGMIERALHSLDWYLGEVNLTSETPQLRLVGNQWRSATGARARAASDAATTVTDNATHVDGGDEQPLDAAATVEALVDAWKYTKNPRYSALARRAFGWFTGDNRAGVPLYDPATGGCRDGLHATRANANMGAESTLAYYQALFALVEEGLLALPQAPGHHTAHRARAHRAPDVGRPSSSATESTTTAGASASAIPSTTVTPATTANSSPSAGESATPAAQAEPGRTRRVTGT